MRTLATGTYTAEQVEAQLRSSAAVDTMTCDVLDRDLNVIGDLTQNITEAVVDLDVDRAVKGSLKLTVTPHDLPDIDDFPTAWFRYYVRPNWCLRMPDGGTATFPMGVFVWHPPDRDITGAPATGGRGDDWTLTLGDRTHDLDMSGPGGAGFKAHPDELVTDVVRRVLVRNGIVDNDGISPSDERLGAFYTWSMTRDAVTTPARLSPSGRRITTEDTEPETWLSIIDQLLDSIGYSSLWFDHDGLPRAQPASALDTTDPQVVYDTAADGVLLSPQKTQHDPGRLANRVWCRAQKRNGTLRIAKADADVVVPGHPISHGVIGRYIDVVEDVKVAPGQKPLEARARKKLLRRLATYQTFDLDTLAWPAHEAYDNVGIQLADDPEFGDQVTMHERSWSMVLRSTGSNEGTMTHHLSRLVQVAPT